MKITVLGCGPSGGVPYINCDCSVCSSNDLYNIRTRSSILIDDGETSLLVDTGPDLRMQALANKITNIDAVFYTHDHADHTHGIDDIRSFNYIKQAPINAYGNLETMRSLEQRFPYIFRADRNKQGWMRASLVPNIIKSGQFFQIGNMDILPFEQIHGKVISYGLRIDNFAYSVDVNVIPERSLKMLEGIDIWIVDCLQYDPSPTHSHLANTLEWIERIKPKLAILTHMNHLMDYHRLRYELPAGVIPAYDGMVLEN